MISDVHAKARTITIIQNSDHLKFARFLCSPNNCSCRYCYSNEKHTATLRSGNHQNERRLRRLAILNAKIIRFSEMCAFQLRKKYKKKNSMDYMLLVSERKILLFQLFQPVDFFLLLAVGVEGALFQIIVGGFPLGGLSLCLCQLLLKGGDGLF